MCLLSSMSPRLLHPAMKDAPALSRRKAGAIRRFHLMNGAYSWLIAMRIKLCRLRPTQWGVQLNPVDPRTRERGNVICVRVKLIFFPSALSLNGDLPLHRRVGGKRVKRLWFPTWHWGLQDEARGAGLFRCIRGLSVCFLRDYEWERGGLGHRGRSKPGLFCTATQPQ